MLYWRWSGTILGIIVMIPHWMNMVLTDSKHFLGFGPMLFKVCAINILKIWKSPPALAYINSIFVNDLQVDGMKKPCTGSMDKNLPKEILWKNFPHRLYFGRDSTRTWGPGGVAFLHPDNSVGEKTYMCLYKITYVPVSFLFFFPFKFLMCISPSRCFEVNLGLC